MPTRKRATQTRRRSRVATKRVRRTASKATMKSKLGMAMGKTLRQMKQAAVKVADVTGAVVTTAKKRVKREVARRHLKQKVRRTGRALKAVARTAMAAGAAAGAARAAREIEGVKRA